MIGEPGATGPIATPDGSRPPGTPPPPPVACAPTDVRPTGTGLRRLTVTEYRNSVAALFPGVTLPELTLSGNARVGGFDNNVAGQGVSALLVEQYGTAAEGIARAAAATRAWAPCATADAACGHATARALATRAYRRPLTEPEGRELDALFDASMADGDYAIALADVIQAVLQSPDFLYRPEFGAGSTAPAGLTALTDHELATRLSYFLHRAPPDDALRRAADAGELAAPGGLERHARRLLGDPRAREMVRDFHAQWFRLDRLASAPISPERFPEFTPDVRESLHAATLRFIDRAFWDAGTLDALLTTPGAYVDQRTAFLYEVPPPPAGAEPVWVALDPARRAGILTQAGVLASSSHGVTHSPIFRGLFVLEGLLCAPLGSPPAGVAAVFDGVPAGTARTTRQHFEASHRQPTCAGCHDRIDGAGFTFEHYDAIGRYRTMENGLPVNAATTIVGTRDADGPVADGVALARQLAQSGQVRECVARHWFRYALGRTEREDEQCQVRDLADGLASAGGNLRELVVRLATSPSFRFRPTP